MLGSLMNYEFEIVWKVDVVAKFEVICGNLKNGLREP
jgi:hypothetical protein